ncbi:MAG: helix-turn-helix domain-containing protein [Candidatus Saccharimonas sp.]|nr:MAG: helix-turn-helix domain-containing protein [Candidatus Saccharimonas sp.]
MESNNSKYIRFYRTTYAPLVNAYLADGRTCNHTIANLYTLIEQLAEKKGFCFATNESLAEEQGCSIRTLKRHLSLLNKAGWVHVELHASKGIRKRKGIYPLLTVDKDARKIYKQDGTEIVPVEWGKAYREDAAVKDDYTYEDEPAIIETPEEQLLDNKLDDKPLPESCENTAKSYNKDEHDKMFMNSSYELQRAQINCLRKKGDFAAAARFEEMMNESSVEPQEQQYVEPLPAATTVDELLPTENPAGTNRAETRELTTAEQCALQTKNIEADNYDRRGNIVDDDLYHKLKLEVIAESDAEKATEESKIQDTPAKQIEANTQLNSTSTEVATVSNNAPAQQQTATTNPYGELATPMTSTRKNYNPAEKAFYDAAKALGVSIANHNQARSWVKEVVRTRGLESTVKYFDFMRLIFPKWEYEYKPNIDSAHDLAMKAAKIEQLIQRQQREKRYKINYQDLDLNKKL